MVVGIVIGSGVFFKAQNILTATNGDMPLGILAWIIGGVIMLFCILAFSSMAQKYEKVNGVVDYAEATVGSKYAYFVGWFFTTIYYPTLVSVLAWLSARFTLTFICSVNPDFQMAIPATEGGAILGPECLALSGLFLVASYALNALSPKLAGKFQVSTTIIKLIPLILMAVVGIIYGLIHNIEGSVDASILASNFGTSKGDVSTLFGAVVATAFAYEGWIIATSINSELKNSKKNLPIALTVGAVIIVAVYIFYYIGVAGGASVETLINDGATVAFTNVFGPVLGNVLNLFIAISCMGTLNGLMLGNVRGLYSIAVRGYGPAVSVYKQIDPNTNMPTNSSIFGLLLAGIWLVFFYGSQLTHGWFGYFDFDSSELPIVTVYALYIPIFIMFIKKAKDVSFVKRFVLPILAICGSLFMVVAAFYAHGYVKFEAAKESGGFDCPILFYLIVFAVIMLIGVFYMNPKKNAEKCKKKYEDK